LVTVALLEAENQHIHLQKPIRGTTEETKHSVAPELGCSMDSEHFGYVPSLLERNRRSWRIEETQKRTEFQVGRGFRAKAGKEGGV